MCKTETVLVTADTTTEGTTPALQNSLSERTSAGHVARTSLPADVCKALLTGEVEEEEENRGRGSGQERGQGEEEEGEGGGEGENEGEIPGKFEGIKYLPPEKYRPPSRFPSPVNFRGVPRRPLYKHLAAALFHYCHTGSLPSGMLTCQGMEEKERRRGEEVDRWHGTVTDAGGRLLELLKEYADSARKEIKEIQDLDAIEAVDEIIGIEGIKRNEEIKEGSPRRRGHVGTRRAHQLHVQAEYLEQLAEGEKTVEGRCNLPPYSSIIAGDLLTSVRAYPSFHHMLASQGLPAVLPGVKTLEEGVAVYRRFYSEEKEQRAGVLAIRVGPAITGAGKEEGVYQACGSADVDGRHADVESQLGSLIHRILVAMGPGGVSRLVGMRVTEGTVLTALPPSSSALLASFQKPVGGGVQGRKQRQRQARREMVQKQVEHRKQQRKKQQEQREQEQREQEQKARLDICASECEECCCCRREPETSQSERSEVCVCRGALGTSEGQSAHLEASRVQASEGPSQFTCTCGGGCQWASDMGPSTGRGSEASSMAPCTTGDMHMVPCTTGDMHMVPCTTGDMHMAPCTCRGGRLEASLMAPCTTGDMQMVPCTCTRGAGGGSAHDCALDELVPAPSRHIHSHSQSALLKPHPRAHVEALTVGARALSKHYQTQPAVCSHDPESPAGSLATHAQPPLTSSVLPRGNVEALPVGAGLLSEHCCTQRPAVGDSEAPTAVGHTLQPAPSRPHPRANVEALTVGARALSKHCHRGREGFWGDASGPDAKKNQHALACVKNLLDNATWMNVHALPHDLPVFELREPEGYGARWSADGSQFRGFLEPQMPDGHERRWRH
ncbi:hypothetical protein CLOM_g22296 [Closterium sp. NIES-68]|nr:hypothetical protein CLOM_g22296 [Closterium sp. NIES-68]GJP64430.1 hypothetical protein CLOP_g21423 [Closterium sp. NIES-67]